MAKPTPEPTFATPDLAPAFALSASVAESVLQAQRMQLEALFAWQKSLAAIAQEFYDEWACRFGGGVPIDG
jgi:hypothetical protein